MGKDNCPIIPTYGSFKLIFKGLNLKLFVNYFSLFNHKGIALLFQRLHNFLNNLKLIRFQKKYIKRVLMQKYREDLANEIIFG